LPFYPKGGTVSKSTIKNHKVDFDKRALRYHHETYHWDADADWHRVSKSNPKNQHYLNRYDSEHDKKLSHRLDAILERAVEERNDDNYKAISRIEDERYPALEPDDSEESSGGHKIKKETPWQKHMKNGPPAKGKRIERDKYGVRVYSNDGKTWWNFLVNTSTKYNGTAVRVMVPPRKDGKPPWAVFDLEAMEAIRREFARGEQPKKH
jgi:hypothetical protein